MGASIAQMIPSLEAASSTGQVILGNGETVSLCRRYFGIKAFDDFIAVFFAFFTPVLGDFDPVARAQAAAFLGDLIPIQVIWLVEGCRRGNVTTTAHLLPSIFGILFQMKGIGFIAPIYFFLYYIQSPLDNYAAAENRLTQIGAVKTTIPTVIITYIVPSIAMFFAPDLATRQWINGLIWQPFPVYASILQHIFGLFVKDTTDTDRITNPEADIPYLRQIYGFAAVTAALGYPETQD